MDEPLTLRDATDADAPVILDVLRAANEEYLRIPGYVSGAHADTVEQMWAVTDHASVIVAEANGKIVGCVFTAPEGDHCDLFRLAVLPAYRRRGIGRTLVEAVEQHARTMGKAFVRLGVRRELPQNLSWYRRLGYQIVPEKISDTGYMMEKRLSGATGS
jgi:ribosomal protein S18 acetylase RimI-like enzyme